MKYVMEIKDSSKVFFISDPHFNHGNIIKFCARPWETKEEMTEAMINNWNSVVGPDDIVFCLGDFMWASSWNTTLERLNGHIHLIWGNHDRKDFKESYLRHIESVQEQLTLIIDNKIVYLNHFPFLCLPAGHYQLFGHIHLSTEKNEGYDFMRSHSLQPNQYDVGADLNNYTPISWKQVWERLKYQKDNNLNCLYWIKNESSSDK